MRATCLLATVLLAAATAAASAEPAIVLLGRGVQVYACAASDAGPAWKLQGPEAELVDAAGQVVGRHFAGPSWQAADGSTVVGEPLVASAAPVAGAVPWLVLRVRSHAGAGRFAPVTYVVRSATEGGVAPEAGCDAAHLGSEARIPYRASYTLFGG